MSIKIIDVINNIKKYKGLHTDLEVAIALKMTKGNFSNHKTKNRIPFERIIMFCEEEKINPAKILYGTDKTPASEIISMKYSKDNITPTETTDEPPSTLLNALAQHNTSHEKLSPSDSPPDTQDAMKYAMIAYKILTSGTGYASALRENITWFDEAVDDKKRIRKLEDDMEALKEQLLASGTLSSR